MELIVMGFFKELEIKIAFYCHLEVLDLEILFEKYCFKEICLMHLSTDLLEKEGSVSVLSWLEQQTSSSNTDYISVCRVCTPEEEASI